MKDLLRKLRSNHVLVLTEWYRRRHPDLIVWGSDNGISWRTRGSVLRKLEDGSWRTTRILVFVDAADALAFRVRWS